MRPTAMNFAQPDVTLMLDMEGVIRKVTLSGVIADEGVDSWVGRPWVETVGDVGGDKIRRMVEDARTDGVSAFRQINQRFPSGLELAIEYSAIRLSAKAGLMVIGKNLQAVAELQSRLIAAQQAMEQDYWKLREVETRYRLLFDASNEPVLLIKAADLRIIEANAAAIRALGMTTSGRLLLPELAPKEQAPFQAMLLRVREHGKAPGVLVHLGRDREPWLVRASLMTAEPGPVFLLQLTPVGAAQTLPNWGGAVSVDEMVGRLPDGFVVLDANGVVVRANQAFLDLVQVGSEGAVVGERLARWLWRPGADLTVLLANVRQHGAVRLFVTTIHGELGLDTEVEISAGGDLDREPAFVAALVRDVGRRLAAPGQRNNVNALSGAWADQIGKTSLEGLVKSTVGVVERQYIEAALDLTKGNRTAAAQLLGLSRQSLYAKLHRYGLNGSATDRS